MSIVTDVITLGAVAVVGLYLYNGNNKVKAVVDTSKDIATTTLTPSATTQEGFKKKSDLAVNTVSDILDVDLPTIPKELTNIVYDAIQNPVNPVVSVVTESVKESIKEDPIKVTGVNTDGSVSTPTKLLTDTVGDILTGKFKWTGFKNPLA